MFVFPLISTFQFKQLFSNAVYYWINFKRWHLKKILNPTKKNAVIIIIGKNISTQCRKNKEVCWVAQKRWKKDRQIDVFPFHKKVKFQSCKIITWNFSFDASTTLFLFLNASIPSKTSKKFLFSLYRTIQLA